MSAGGTSAWSRERVAASVAPLQLVSSQAPIGSGSGIGLPGSADASVAITSGTIWAGEQAIGEVDLVFSHVDQNMRGLKLPEENFVFTEQFMSLFNSFKAENGARGG